MSDSNQNNVTLEVKSIKINLTPYALGQFVRDLEPAIKAIDTSERFSAAKFFLVCLSIEISFKSCLLAAGLSGNAIHGHNIALLSKSFKANVDDELLSDIDYSNLQKALRFYDRDGKISKGIVYFESNMKEQVLKGYKDLPDLDSLIAVKDKLSGLLEGNDYYIRL